MQWRNIAQTIRLAKLKHPQYYCYNPRCLHRTITGPSGVPGMDHAIRVRPCPKHQGTCTCENNGDYCPACSKVLHFKDLCVQAQEQLETLARLNENSRT